MPINLIIKKFNYILFKIYSYPIEKFSSLFIKSYSKVYFISDNASWATDNTTNSIIKFFNRFNIPNSKVLHEPKKQYVFYTDQYSLLKNFFIYNKNIIAIDYQHGVSKYIPNNKKLLRMIKKYQKYIKLIRVTNSFFRNYLIKKGIKKSKIIKIPLTVDTTLFKKVDNKDQIRKKFNLPLRKFLIGSFHKDGNGWDDGNTPKFIKGPDIFIKTIVEIKKKIGKNAFCVVLTAPARGYVKNQLKKNNIDFYHFNPINSDQVPLLYNCLDLYLITSRDEGGPTGMFEAMSCGIPVVSTLVGHAHDFIKNYHNGFKCDLEDSKSLANFSIKIFKNLKLIKKIIKNSILIANQNSHKKHLKK